MSFLNSMKIAVFDIETTGVDKEKDRIVQIGVVQVDDGEVVGEWSQRLNPGCEIPEVTTKIHGISDEMVKDAPLFADVWPTFAEKVRGRRLLGYNAQTFDSPFIREEMKRAGMEVSKDQVTVIDPLVWVREIDRFVRGKGRHKLTTTCKRWKIDVLDAHDALGDCRMTWQLASKVFAHSRVPEDFGTCLSKQEVLAEEQDRQFQAYLARKGEASG